MIIGGLKFRLQRFNPRSANISASLLFVAVIGEALIDTAPYKFLVFH